MLTSILISALTCLAMAWLPIHHVLPSKEVPNASTQNEPRQLAEAVQQDGVAVAQEKLPRRADARRHPPVGGGLLSPAPRVPIKAG